VPSRPSVFSKAAERAVILCDPKTRRFGALRLCRRPFRVPIMEKITPPMPAKRALAALDQPAPADIDRSKRISKRVRAAIAVIRPPRCWTNLSASIGHAMLLAGRGRR
jgi:hypothetical protein